MNVQQVVEELSKITRTSPKRKKQEDQSVDLSENGGDTEQNCDSHDRVVSTFKLKKFDVRIKKLNIHRIQFQY